MKRMWRLQEFDVVGCNPLEMQPSESHQVFEDTCSRSSPNEPFMETNLSQ